MDGDATRSADPDPEGSGSGTSAEEFAGQRAASLRRMFPGGPQPLITTSVAAEPAAAPPPAAAPLPPAASSLAAASQRPGAAASERPGPAAAAKPTDAPAEGPGRRGRRWWWLAAVLTLGAAAGVVTLRQTADTREIPVPPPAGQPLAALSPATGALVGPEPGSTSASAATHPSAAPPPPSASARSAAPATSAAKSAAPPPAGKTSPVATTTTAAPGTARPISGYSACITNNAAVFSVTFNVDFTWRHAFVDADGDTQTGYRVDEVPGGLGADYMIENGVLYRSTGSQWSWAEAGAVGQSLRGGAHRWQVPLASIGSPSRPAVVYNGSGGSPDASTPVVVARAC